MKYAALYKCPLCGRRLQYGEARQVSPEQLPELLGKVIRNQLFAGNPALYQAPMYIPCQCTDGSAGLAAFAGFMRME